LAILKVQISRYHLSPIYIFAVFFFTILTKFKVKWRICKTKLSKWNGERWINLPGENTKCIEIVNDTTIWIMRDTPKFNGVVMKWLGASV
jgi:hypothetical protein